MFSFFKRQKQQTLSDLSILQIDMHSHLIPGVDDGAPDLETAIDLVQQLINLGYKELITTPHIMADLYPNTSKILLEGLDQLRTGLRVAGIEIPIYIAAEYLLDEGFESKLNENKLLTIKDNIVLVEMSFVAPPPNLNSLLFNLQTKGYKPIMAHPERYMYLHNDFSLYEKLRNRGCYFQLNLLSLSGYYGKAVRQIALKLLKANMVEFIGTDVHNHRHIEEIQKALTSKKFVKLLETYSFKNATLLS